MRHVFTMWSMCNSWYYRFSICDDIANDITKGYDVTKGMILQKVRILKKVIILQKVI